MKLTSFSILFALGLSSPAFASGPTCESLFSGHASGEHQALVLQAPAPELAKSLAVLDERSSRLATTILELAHREPHSAGYRASEVFEKLVETSMAKSSELVTYLVRNDGQQSLTAETAEMSAVSAQLQKGHSRLMKILEPSFIARVITRRSESAVQKKIREATEELRTCQAQAQVCSTRLRTKIESLNEHAASVRVAQLELENLVHVIRSTLNRVAETEPNQMITAQVFEAGEGVLTNLGFVRDSLIQHVGSESGIGAIGLQISNAGKALTLAKTMSVMVDAAIQRGVPYTAKLLATEKQWDDRLEGDLLTLEEQALLAKFEKKKFDAYFWPSKALREVAKIPNWRATNEILSIALRAKSKSHIAEVKQALTGRRLKAENVPALQRVLTDSHLPKELVREVADAVVYQNQLPELIDMLIEMKMPTEHSRYYQWAPDMKKLKLTNAQLPVLAKAFSESRNVYAYYYTNTKRRFVVDLYIQLGTPEAKAVLAKIAKGGWGIIGTTLASNWRPSGYDQQYNWQVSLQNEKDTIAQAKAALD